MAERFGMNYVEINGTVDWLARLAGETWGEDFVVVEPGQPIETWHFLPAASRKAKP